MTTELINRKPDLLEDYFTTLQAPSASFQADERRMTITLDKLRSIANRVAVMDCREPRVQEIQNNVNQVLNLAKLMLLTDFTAVEVSEQVESSMLELEIRIAQVHLSRMEYLRATGRPLKCSSSLTKGNSLHFSNDGLHSYLSKL